MIFGLYKIPLPADACVLLESYCNEFEVSAGIIICMQIQACSLSDFERERSFVCSCNLSTLVI